MAMARTHGVCWSGSGIVSAERPNGPGSHAPQGLVGAFLLPRTAPESFSLAQPSGPY
jgi:hypothetical protein